MLYIAKSLNDLDFRALMDIYEEGNAEKGDILQAEQDFYQYLRQVFFKTEGAYYCLWQVDGIFVSALRLEPFMDGLLLEALETAPGKRRMGYATALIQAVLSHTGAEKIYAHVHKRNLPSLKTHRKCGFEIVSEVARYIDGSVNTNSYTMCMEP